MKRGKKEEYLQTEDAMREAILDMGTGSIIVTQVKGNKALTEKQLKDLLFNIFDCVCLLG